MTLPTTGPISLGQVRTELSLSGAVSLGQTAVRSLAGKPNGQINMSDLRGKTYVPPVNTINYSLTAGLSGGLCGFYALGQIGSISPGTYSGYNIMACYVQNYSGACSVLFSIPTRSGNTIQTVKSITIGGFKFNFTNWFVATDQKDFSGSRATANITLEQYNAIVAAINGKTTPVIIEYF